MYRVRNLIKQKSGPHEFLAEEMLLWGYSGNPVDGKPLGMLEAKELLLTAKVKSDVHYDQQNQFLKRELDAIENMQDKADSIARERSENLVEAHERYRKALRGSEYVVGAVLPMDLMGIYILLPEIDL